MNENYFTLSVNIKINYFSVEKREYKTAFYSSRKTTNVTNKHSPS